MKRLKQFLKLGLCLFMLNSGVSLAETPVLHKGVNLSAWLANTPRQPLFDRDFKQIRQAGFDNVRLPFNPEMFNFHLEQRTATANSMNIQPLDKAVKMALDNQLSIVIDIHPNKSFMDTLERNPDWAEQAFINFWVFMAQHYKNYSSRLAFELLNEPQYYKKETEYADFVKRLVAAIRQVDQKHLIIVGGPDGSSIRGLLQIKPIPDPNIAYTFHFYEPYVITHQGVHRGFEGTMVRYFHEIPYPSSEVNKAADAYTKNAPNPQQAQSELNEYVNAHWNANHISERLKIAKDWADRAHVKLVCTEFGVLRNHIDPDSRYRWIADVRKALEADGIGWQIWEYADLDGITTPIGTTKTDPGDGAVSLVNPLAGSRVFDPQAFQALGLHKPAR